MRVVSRTCTCGSGSISRQMCGFSLRWDQARWLACRRSRIQRLVRWIGSSLADTHIRRNLRLILLRIWLVCRICLIVLPWRLIALHGLLMTLRWNHASSLHPRKHFFSNFHGFCVCCGSSPSVCIHTGPNEEYEIFRDNENMHQDKKQRARTYGVI